MASGGCSELVQRRRGELVEGHPGKLVQGAAASSRLDGASNSRTGGELMPGRCGELAPGRAAGLRRGGGKLVPGQRGKLVLSCKVSAASLHLVERTGLQGQCGELAASPPVRALAAAHARPPTSAPRARHRTHSGLYAGHASSTSIHLPEPAAPCWRSPVVEHSHGYQVGEEEEEHGEEEHLRAVSSGKKAMGNIPMKSSVSRAFYRSPTTIGIIPVSYRFHGQNSKNLNIWCRLHITYGYLTCAINYVVEKLEISAPLNLSCPENN